MGTVLEVPDYAVSNGDHRGMTKSNWRLGLKSHFLENVGGKQSVSQLGTVCIAFVAVATAIHCERSCARENVLVRDKPVSEEMWSSQVVLGRPLECLQEGSGGYPSPEAQHTQRMLDDGTSRLNLVTWPNNPNQSAQTMLMILSKPDVASTV